MYVQGVCSGIVYAADVCSGVDVFTTISALLLGPLLQVVLTISQLMWCRDMDNCLEGDHDHLQALQEFEQTNIEVELLFIFI